MAAPERSPKSHSSLGLLIVRYGIGAAMVIAGIVLLVAVPGTGVDGFAMAAGGGLSVLLINFLFRMGVSGDEEREREEAARRYFDEHGEWPAEVERTPRAWRLPPGVVTPEQEREQSAPQRSAGR